MRDSDLGQFLENRAILCYGCAIKREACIVEIGRINKLAVVKKTDFGVYLDGQEDGEILLPKNAVPNPCEVGDLLDVFIYFDSEDRMIATTKMPKAMVGEFASLPLVSVENVGAFLDWGLTKDLFLPFAEQTKDLRRGQNVVVFIYLDKSQRISASMRLERYIDKEPGDYKEGQSVSLLITGATDLGIKALINGRHWGVLYDNEVFQTLTYGQQIPGFIKKVRDDGKIDLSLHPAGYKAAEDIGEKIMSLLKAKGGFLPFNDKTSAELIYDNFGVSKKKYKMALGGLYKKRLIVVTDEGIRLVP